MVNIFSDLGLSSKTSVYSQIIQHAKCRTLNKSIIAYTPLPSQRELMSLLSTNPNTVQKSYKLMEEEGILRTISNVKDVICVDKQITECPQQEMIQETMNDFITNYRECRLPF